MRRAEIKVATAIVKHNIPIAFTDHLSPLMKGIFPDSEIAKNYSSARTKIGALSPFLQNCLVENMKQKPFTISIDGSNDTGNISDILLTSFITFIKGLIFKYIYIYI